MMFIALCLLTIFSLFIFRRWLKGPMYNKTTRIDGKVVIVTGCNTGMGKEIALEMARRGGRVYMACMDYRDCEEARQEIVQISGNPNVFNRQLDLSSFKTIRKFVEKFNKDESQLDILINNAGIVTIMQKIKTVEGYDLQMAVNHLGHFLLTNLLLDKLKSAASSRIVVVASVIYKLGRILKDDFNNDKSLFGFTGYFNSKLANVLFTRKLADILKGSNVTVNCLHPGIVRTNLLGFNGIMLNVFKVVGKILLRSPRGGAQTSIFLALDPEMEGKSGGYYDRMKLQKFSANALDDDMADWLWNKSELIVGLREQNSENY